MAAVRLNQVVLGEGRTKVIVPITGVDVAELMAQATELANHELDIVEWRVDHLNDAPRTDAVLSAASQLRTILADRPILFTFRTAAEGGAKTIEPATYAALNIAVIESGLIEAVDVEHHFDQAAGEAVIAAAKANDVAVVGSFHDFTGTPAAEELVSYLVGMQRRGCDIGKVAGLPHDPGDVLTLLSVTWTMADRYPQTPVLTMSMGGLGLLTRMAGQVVGSCATFAMVGRPSAPGQVPVEDLQPVLRLLDANL